MRPPPPTKTHEGHYYLFDKDRFRLLRKAEEHWPGRPEETEDED